MQALAGRVWKHHLGLPGADHAYFFLFTHLVVDKVGEVR